MYYPYFRGKQFELITIREIAQLLSESGFVPIIEPVKAALLGVERTLKAICEANGRAIVIINPDYGDHAHKGEDISFLLRDVFIDEPNISAGILLNEQTSVVQTIAYYEQHKPHKPVFIHSGFMQHKELAEKLGEDITKSTHVFLEKYCGKLYRKHFRGSTRILLRDGFEKRRNADHPDLEEFSDLHVTFQEEDMDGFGDFLIVGDDYSESGGPAYAVAIHLTFIDDTKDDAMFIRHFISDTKDTPTDPAGKFGQALQKLINTLDSGNSKIIESSAITEFRELHAKQHFPGLGYVKKLSMKHHIETLANYFSE
jgi:hypothetical protein